ncbi:MAG: helix-turn-helix transcriptional regulator [Alphaproteobacteria bacterium]|nr:helix-turn-helix transcriptional regulator [Alphaproteobacteria bacterium]
MSQDINSTKHELWDSFGRREEDRHAFVEATLSSGIGAQIFALREARGWSQEELGEKVGMAQSRISLLEGGYESYSLRTLKRFASVFDVALVVRFIPFSELVDWVTGLSEDRLAPVDFVNDNLRSGPPEEQHAQPAFQLPPDAYFAGVDPHTLLFQGSNASPYVVGVPTTMIGTLSGAAGQAGNAGAFNAIVSGVRLATMGARNMSITDSSSNAGTVTVQAATAPTAPARYWLDQDDSTPVQIGLGMANVNTPEYGHG